MQFGEHQLRLNVPVALSEALANAIQKGNCDDPMRNGARDNITRDASSLDNEMHVDLREDLRIG